MGWGGVEVRRVLERGRIGVAKRKLMNTDVEEVFWICAIFNF